MSEPDNQLIAEFNACRSEEAFAALVRQHVNLVFATALRQVGDAGAAEEITQNVFVALAQAAGKLGSHPTIAGWLHQTALNKSREWLRSELRRRKREQVAVNLDLARAEGDSVWSSLVPLLDEALLELREPDRLAVILHFMEGQTFHEVGSALGIGEDTARKRVNRCLGQLTHFFRRRGFAAPALVAGAPLFTLSSHAAPAGLAASATSAGLMAHSTSSTLTLIKGALKIMAWTKAKTAVVIGAGVLLAAVTTTVIVKESNLFKVNKSSGIDAYISDSDMQVFLVAPPIIAIQTTHFPKYQGITARFYGSKMAGRDQTLQELIAIAYHFHIPRIIFPPNMPTNHYDFLCTVANNPHEKFQAEIANTLGYTAQVETKAVDCQLLKVADAGVGKLKAGDSSQPVPLDHRIAFDYPNHPISALANALEIRFRMPVIDQTGLAGKYNMVVDWHWQGAWNGKDRETNLNSLKKVILDRFGLELISTNMPIEMLVVERVKS